MANRRVSPYIIKIMGKEVIVLGVRILPHNEAPPLALISKAGRVEINFHMVILRIFRIVFYAKIAYGIPIVDANQRKRLD